MLTARARHSFVWLASIVGAVMLLQPAAQAEDVWIAPDTPRVEFKIGADSFVIERIQDKENAISGTFAKTSRSCPPFCIHPMKAAEGVETVGELEIMDFLKKKVSKGSGLLVDARIPEWHHKGTIPGSVNIPFTLFSSKNPYLDDLLLVLGAERAGEGDWAFDDAKELVMFCNGPWCDQSPRAIAGLLEIGYPSEKLYYYRGGMQNWSVLGLSTSIPTGPATAGRQ